jgi:hypothetical protein
MSGAVIGSLRAELSANIAKFQSDMGQAADTIKKFSREAKKVGREIEDVGKSMSIALTLPLVALGTERRQKGERRGAGLGAFARHDRERRQQPRARRPSSSRKPPNSCARSLDV